MRTDRPTTVPHPARWAKRALSIALLVVLFGSLATPATSLAAGLTRPISSPAGLSRPLDGVGDSPIMP